MVVLTVAIGADIDCGCFAGAFEGTTQPCSTKNEPKFKYFIRRCVARSACSMHLKSGLVFNIWRHELICCTIKTWVLSSFGLFSFLMLESLSVIYNDVDNCHCFDNYECLF